MQTLSRSLGSRVSLFHRFRQRRTHLRRRFETIRLEVLESRELLSGNTADVGDASPALTMRTAHIDSAGTDNPSSVRPVGSRDPGSSKQSPGVSWTETQNMPFPTIDGQSELLDVYQPNTPAPPGGRPVMVAIHGGGWRRFNKAGFGERIAIAFASAGYVVVAPDYQLSKPGIPSWPVNFDQVQAAVSWVRERALALDINPNEITAIGESAGANLAALLGTSSPQSIGGVTSSAVDAVVAFSTPSDLTSLYKESPSAGEAAFQFLGGSPQEVPANYVAASPLDHVAATDPPMLLVHGLQDPLIPVSQSEEMAQALTSAGVRNQLILVRGGHKLDFPARYSKLIPQILEFLQTTWKDN
jgi:acetyl esterase/lipase